MVYPIIEGDGRTEEVDPLPWASSCPARLDGGVLIRPAGLNAKTGVVAMSCPNSKTVRSYLTPDEYDTVSGLTMATTLSVSTFMHKVCPMQEIKSFEDEVPKKAKPLWTYQL